MNKRRESAKLAAKKRQWDKVLADFNRIWNNVKRELKKDGNDMINFILFYKPKNKLDKILHIFEIACFYVILQFAWLGIAGR